MKEESNSEPKLNEKGRNKQGRGDRPNQLKLIFKENHEDLVEDPKIGNKYQRLPDGGFSEPKKVAVDGRDGSKKVI